MVITKETKGTFLTNIDGYKLVEKGGLREYVNIRIPANATFKVINFNTNTKRLYIFLHVKGMASEAVEIDYTNLLERVRVDNSGVTSPIEGIVVSDRLEYILNGEAIKTFMVYLVITVAGFLVGRI